VGNLETNDATNQRGLHDITNEMVFTSNRVSFFHDSPWVEAGGNVELNM